MKFGKEDSKILGEIYVLTQQLRNSIALLAHNSEATPEELPPSELPTDIVLNICIAYGIMYDRLEKESLMTPVTSTKTKH